MLTSSRAHRKQVALLPFAFGSTGEVLAFIFTLAFLLAFILVFVFALGLALTLILSLTFTFLGLLVSDVLVWEGLFEVDCSSRGFNFGPCSIVLLALSRRYCLGSARGHRRLTSWRHFLDGTSRRLRRCFRRFRHRSG